MQFPCIGLVLDLRTRLIVTFLGITVIPLGALVTVNHLTVSQILTDNARRSLASSARATAHQLNRFLNESLDTVRVEAILPEIVRYVETPSPEYYPTAIETLLSLARRDSINVLSYGLIQRSGENVLDTYTPFIGRQEGEREAILQAIVTGLPYVDALRKAERRERLGEVTFSAPVRNAKGKVIGVLRVAYNATVLAQIIQQQTGNAGEESFAVLLDGDGVRLAHGRDAEWAYIPLLPLTELRRSQLAQQYPRLGDPPVSVDPLLQEVIAQRQSITLTTQLPELGSQRALVSVAPLQTAPWLVMMVQPEGVFLAPIHQQTQRYLALGLGLAGGVVGVGIWAGQVLAKPVVTLTHLLKQFHRGSHQGSAVAVQEQLIQPLEGYAKQLQSPAQAWQGFAELGILTQAFVRLAHELQGSLTELTLVNSELEERVMARTAALHQANAEIASLNQRLRAENRRLSTELEVTRRLQQMILPRQEELSGIPDLEIAGYMEPATEVGGDYYDVLPYEDRVRIGIGDVTGHGLESGMVMLMVQMAVRTLLSQGETDLRRFLQILNGAVYANVHRMHTDKNLTLTLLDYHRGRVLVAGQHEEVLWWRPGRHPGHNSQEQGPDVPDPSGHCFGELRRIDTLDLGFPVGLEPDISPWINQMEIHLDPGDMLILYTDGIIEARGENKKLYGLERLCHVITTQGYGSAADLLAAIMADVRDHIGNQPIDDDLTLLIVRQR